MSLGGDVEGKAGYHLKEMDLKKLSKTYRIKHSTNKFSEPESSQTQLLSLLLHTKAIMWTSSSLAQDALDYSPSLSPQRNPPKNVIQCNHGSNF